MAMGKQKTERQQELWIPATEMPEAPGHPFYRRLNEFLAQEGFDRFVEGLCEKFYAEALGRLLRSGHASTAFQGDQTPSRIAR